MNLIDCKGCNTTGGHVSCSVHGFGPKQKLDKPVTINVSEILRKLYNVNR